MKKAYIFLLLVTVVVNGVIFMLIREAYSYKSTAVNPVALQNLRCLNLLNHGEVKKIAIVQNFMLLTLPEYKDTFKYDKKISYSGYNPGKIPSDHQFLERQEELNKVLQSNLNHDMVGSVHAIVSSQEVVVYLMGLNLDNASKLIIQNVHNDTTIKKIYGYGCKCLKQNIVAVINSDIMLGMGWNKLNFSILRENRIMYALTRHPSTNSYCRWLGNCGRDSRSHDVFVFQPSDEIFKQIDHEILDTSSQGLWGQENMIVWLFKNKLNYTVLNPCFILKVHHEHCMPIRRRTNHNININGKSDYVSTNYIQLM